MDSNNIGGFQLARRKDAGSLGITLRLTIPKAVICGSTRRRTSSYQKSGVRGQQSSIPNRPPAPRPPTSDLRPLCPTVCALLAGFLTIAQSSAQDALRHSLAGEQAARRQSIERQDYNLRLGDARFTVDAGLTLEYNDNVTYEDSSGDVQDDIILTPRLNNRLFWPITQRNALTFSLGLGYAKYFNHSEYDYFILAPGSQLSFDLFVGDFRFTIYDRFSYTQDPQNNAAVRGVPRYGGIDNSAGLNVLWDLNKVILTAGYAHRDYFAEPEEFDYLSRSSELFFARASFLLDNGVALGPEASSSITSYDQSVLNDSFSYSVGGFAEAQLSPHMRVGAHAGYVTYEFEEGDRTIPSENPQTYYFSVDMAHTLNEYISHTLRGGREIVGGTWSNFQEEYFARYSITWRIIRDVGLTTGLFYENGSYPPLIVQGAAGPQTALAAEDYERFGANINVSYQLMRKLRTTLSYRFLLRQSENERFDYKQNAVVLGMTYRF